MRRTRNSIKRSSASENHEEQPVNKKTKTPPEEFMSVENSKTKKLSNQLLKEYSAEDSDSDFEQSTSKKNRKSKRTKLCSKTQGIRETNKNESRKIQKKASTNRDELSSESDIGDYLQPADKIDFNSTFFKPLKSPEKESKATFENIENNILAGIVRLSESSDTEDEGTASTGKKGDTNNFKQTTNDLKQVVNGKQLDQTEDFINESSDMFDEKGTNNMLVSNFTELTEYKQKLEDAKRQIEKYQAEKQKSKMASEVINNSNIKNLLAQGENCKEDLFSEESKKSSFNSNGYEDLSDSDRDDWEDVKTQKIQEDVVPSKNIEITVQMSSNKNQKKKKVDFVASMKRRLNRIRKINQVFVHKVHLLCWLGHGFYINSCLNNKNIQASALSLLPSKYSNTKKQFNRKNLNLLVDWYKDNFKLLPQKFPKNIPLHRALLMQILAKEAYSKKSFIYLFICLLRSICIDCRLVLSFQVEPLRPPVEELHSLSTKSNDKNKGAKLKKHLEADIEEIDETYNEDSQLENKNKEKTIVEKEISNNGDENTTIKNESHSKSKQFQITPKNKKQNLNLKKELFVKLTPLNTKILSLKEDKSYTDEKQKSSKNLSKNTKIQFEDDASVSKKKKDNKSKQKNNKTKSLKGRKKASSKNIENGSDDEKINRPVIKIKLPERPKRQSRRVKVPQLDGCDDSDDSSIDFPTEFLLNNRKRIFSLAFNITEHNSYDNLMPFKILQLDGVADSDNIFEKNLKKRRSRRSLPTANYKELDSEEEFDSPINATKKINGKGRTCSLGVLPSKLKEDEVTVIKKGKSVKVLNFDSGTDSDYIPEKQSSEENESEESESEINDESDWEHSDDEEDVKNKKVKYNQRIKPSTIKAVNRKYEHLKALKEKCESLKLLKENKNNRSINNENSYNSKVKVSALAQKKLENKKSRPRQLIDVLTSDEESDETNKVFAEEEVKNRCRKKKITLNKRAMSLPEINIKTLNKHNNKVLSSDSEDDFEAAEKNGIKRSKRYQSEKKGMDVWLEVYLESEKKWISIDLFAGQIECSSELYSKATHPVTYVISWDNSDKVKDVTARYCPKLNTDTRKLRIDSEWWNETLQPFIGEKTSKDEKEDEELESLQLKQPLPNTISEYKNHPLYALKRHLLKYEGIYPPDAPAVGFIRKEPVYSRQCVVNLHTRETWLKSAKVVRPGEKPYKIVRARPRWDKYAKKIITDELADLFGPWQVDDYVPPTAENGIVPKNEYGNVELFQPSMLPKKTVHLKLPGLSRIARRMNIDCAPAFTGFDFTSGWFHPRFEGYVVCEEFEDILVAAWTLEQEEQERREQEKYEKRVYDNWKKLIKGLLIKERLKAKYDFGKSSGDKKKVAEQGSKVNKKKKN